MDRIVADQLNKTTEAPTNKFQAESNGPQENAEEAAMTSQSEQQENCVPSKGLSEKGISLVTERSSAEAFLPGLDVTDLVNTDKEIEETSKFPRQRKATSIIDDQIHEGTEESVGRQKAAPSTEEAEDKGKPVQFSIVEGLENRSSEVRSKPESNKIKEDHSVRELEKDVSLVKKVVSDFETHQVFATSDNIQAGNNLGEITTVTSDAPEEVEAEHKQVLDCEVGLNTVGDELSATLNEISTNRVNASEDRSIPDLEAMPELVDHSEQHKIDKGHAKTGIADAGEKTFHSVSKRITNQEEGQLGDSNLISVSEEITTQAQVEGSDVPTIPTFEQHLHTAKGSRPGHKEDHDNQQNIGLGFHKDHVNANVDSISDEEKEEIMVEEGVSLSFSTSNDQYERQDALSTSSQMDAQFISDDNITEEEKDEDTLEEMVLPVQQNISISDGEDEDGTIENASHASSEVDDTLITDDDIYVPENKERSVDVMALHIKQNASIIDDQGEEIEREAASGRDSPLEDQLISEDNIRDGAKEVSPVQQTTIISGEDKEREKEVSSHTVKDKLMSDDSVNDGEIRKKAAPSIQQNIAFSEDQDEKSEREDAARKCSQSDQLMCSINIYDEEKEEDIVIPPLQNNIRVPDDQNVANAKEDISGMSAYVEEEGIMSYCILEEDSQSLESESERLEDVVTSLDIRTGGPALPRLQKSQSQNLKYLVEKSTTKSVCRQQ